MKKKRMGSFAVSLAVTCSMLSVLPLSGAVTYASNTLVDDDFSVNYDGWTNCG